jgi:hypothetical protein
MIHLLILDELWQASFAAIMHFVVATGGSVQVTKLKLTRLKRPTTDRTQAHALVARLNTASRKVFE